jgi:hypothetical protein
VQRDLAVRFRLEMVPLGLKVAADRLEVVELAVGDDVERPVFVGDRLIAGGQVDDAQPRMAQPDAPVGRGPDRLIVRSAVDQPPRGRQYGVR